MGGITNIFKGLFGGGGISKKQKIAQIISATPAPSIDDDEVQRAAEAERRRVARGGRASTIFTTLLEDEGSQSNKRLLGL